MQKEVFAPTCDKEGYTYNFCKCGYHFNSDQVPPTGHTLSQQTIAPTCETEGYTKASCTVCGLQYKTNIVAPLGHELKVERGFVSVNNQSAASKYSCSRCDLDYVGDYLYYNEVYKGAYVDNTEVLCKGIDVSHHNNDKTADGTIDWEKIKQAGFDFVILKVGEMGTGNEFKPDPTFERNYTGAKAAGLGVGAYIYSYAYSVDDAHAEAEAMIKALAGKQFEYPIYFDIEYSEKKITEKGITPLQMTYICREFISLMQENGYFAALYTNDNWLKNHYITERIVADFDIWYARYDSSEIEINKDTWEQSWGKQMAMWQFSETGTIDGIYSNKKTDDSGNIIFDKYYTFDLNYCYKDYPSIMKKFGLNGFPASEQA